MTPKEYEEFFQNLVPSTHPNLCIGWSADEHGFGWSSYHSYCETMIEDMCDGDDAPELMSYKQWQYDNCVEDADDLGFSHESCDICNALPGNRYALTAYDEDRRDYTALKVCWECIAYVANGDYPDYVEV